MLDNKGALTNLSVCVKAPLLCHKDIVCESVVRGMVLISHGY